MQVKALLVISICLLASMPTANCASAFLPDGLKEGRIDPYGGYDEEGAKAVFDAIPSDIEALDLMLSTSYISDWSKLLRFKKLKRIELGGPDEGIGQELCTIYSLPIESFYMRAGEIDRAVTKQMHRLRNLKRLGLCIEATPVHLEDIARLESLRDLRIVCSTSTKISHLRKCPTLRFLDLTPISDKQAFEIAKLSQVEELCMEGDGAANSDGRLTKIGIEAISKMPNLKFLDLSHQDLSEDDMELLSRIHTLERLNIGNTPVTDKGIAHIKSLTNLKALRLTNTNITDACFRDLSALKNLEELDFNGTKTSAAGLQHLKGFAIRRLVTGSISNVNLVYLADLPDLKSLEINGQVNETGAAHLAKCQNLTDLHIDKLQSDLETNAKIFNQLAKMKQLKQISGFNFYGEKQAALLEAQAKDMLPLCKKYYSGDYKEWQPLIRNKHDVTYSFKCFK